MNSIRYHEYKQFKCEKCNDTYCARHGSYSDRTSCRFHCWEKEADGSVVCRDCKRTPANLGSHNCYHVSKEGECCYVCTIS